MKSILCAEGEARQHKHARWTNLVQDDTNAPAVGFPLVNIPLVQKDLRGCTDIDIRSELVRAPS